MPINDSGQSGESRPGPPRYVILVWDSCWDEWVVNWQGSDVVEAEQRAGDKHGWLVDMAEHVTMQAIAERLRSEAGS